MKKLSKLITWPLILIFLYQNIGWTAPISQPSTINYHPSTIFIPEQYGRIEKSVNCTLSTVNSQERPLVVLVKDAHCNYEAQTNISKILDILIRDYKIELVGEEGASGRINPSIVLESNPREEDRKDVSDKFLKNGLLVASEALSINKGRKPGFTIWGIEDLRLYLEDYKAFRDTYRTNPAGKHFIELLSKTIEQLKRKVYPEELQGFDNFVSGYESNEIPLSRFIKVLYYNHGIPSNFKNLKLILKSIRLEESIDFSKVEKERANLIKGLEKSLPSEDLQELIKQSLLYKLGKIPTVEYYTLLEPQAINHKLSTINLVKYIKLVKLQEKLDETILFKELETLSENIYIRLCIDKTSLNLHQLDKDIGILNKIFGLEATRENLAYYKENQSRFKPENLLQFIKIQAPLNNINLAPELNDPSFIEDVNNAITPAEEFYRLAVERDTALVENLLGVMQRNKKDKAVLVCGGFHAEGIKKILQDKGISILTITPSITKLQEDSNEIYLRRMMDERIDPERMLAELGLETLRPPIATGPEGIKIGLPQPLIDALRGRGVELGEGLSPEEFLRILPLLQELYKQNETLRSFIVQAVAEYNAKLPEGAERIVLEKLVDTLPEKVTGMIEAAQTKLKVEPRAPPTTLKAPGSDPLDEDSGAVVYIEDTIKNIHRTIEQKDAVIHTIDLGGQLGLPRFSGAVSARDLVYAYGKKEADGKLHIYITTAFWKILKEDSLLLGFIIDHEYQENILGKSHAEASQGAWEFVDESGINPFYRFYIDQLAKGGDIETLQGLTGRHPNDKDGRFRQYVQDTLTGRKNTVEIDQFRDELASYFEGRQPRILNLTHTTDLSTGLTEVLRNLIRFGTRMGMDINESVPKIRDLGQLTRFFQIAVKIRHALQGERGVEISDDEWGFFAAINEQVSKDIEKEIRDKDIIVLHNHYYLGLVPLIKKINPKIKIIWQCHLEIGDPDPRIWNRLKGYLDEVDLVILQPRSNLRDIYYRLDIRPPALFMPPAIINPTSERHEYLEPAEVEKIKAGYGIDTGRPYFLYTGRYDKEKNIDGAVQAFVRARERLRERIRPQLVIAGTAVNDEERAVYREILALRDKYPGLASDIIIIPPEKIDDHTTNALQQGAVAGLQLAHREGFGLGIAEIMWKGKPVIGMNTGGIAMQIQDAQTGYLVDNIDGAANRMASLLDDPRLALDMGKRAREYVFRNYLITQLIRNYELAFIATQQWLERRRATGINDFHRLLWERIIIKTADKLQKDMEKAFEDRDTKRAIKILERLKLIHDSIWNNFTENGTASVLVIEKLKDMLFEKLREDKTSERIDLACLTLPIASLNKIGYEAANQFKTIFYQRLEDYIKRNRGKLYAAYEQLSGKYYGIAKTRLYVIGLDERDLEYVIREIFPECLREIGIKNTRDFSMYAGHMKISFTDELKDTFNRDRVRNTFMHTAQLIEGLIMDSIKEMTGRAEVAEKVERKTIFGEEDMRDPETRDRVKSGLAQGRYKYIPENEYKTGYIPRLSHISNNLNRVWQMIYDDLRKGTPDTGKMYQYIGLLNIYLIESLLDNRYKRTYKKELINILIAAVVEGVLEWDEPLFITKMGDEVWLYMRTSDGGIVQNFGELDKFNAFNENYPPDMEDSFYHQVLDAIFSLHQDINNGKEFSPGDMERFASQISQYLQESLITIPDSEPYNSSEGYMPLSSPAVVVWDSREKIIAGSRNLLEKNIKTGDNYKLKDLPCHYSEKVKINGEIHRLKLYEARHRETGETRRFVIYNRRIFTADGKGEDNENDITEVVMQKLDSWDINPVTGPINITFTTDLHNLLALDPYRISDLNTHQKKHMDKKSADISEIIAHEIITILEKYGISGIDKNELARVIIEAKEGRINVDFMQLWGLIKGRIEPERFFEIARDISKPLNALLGLEARQKGAQMLNALLKEILENLPERERKEILTREKISDEERLLETIKKAAEEKGMDPNAIQGIFDLFKAGMDILTMDPELDIGEVDGAYFELIRQLETLTGINQGTIFNAFKRTFGIGVKISQGKEIKNSPLQKESRRLGEYNSEYAKETMGLSEVDNKLWDILFTERTVLKTGDKARTRNQFLSAIDAVRKDTDKIANALKGAVDLKEPLAVVLPIDMLIELNPDGTFSYKPGIESILKHNITIGVMVVEGDTRYDNIISVMDKRVRIIRGDVTAAPAQLRVPQNRIAFLFNDTTRIPKGIKAVFVESETPLHVAILFGVVYARIDIETDEGKEVLTKFLKQIGNMRDDEIRKTFSDLNRQGWFTLRLIRIEKTLQEFRNRKLFIEVAA